MLYSVEFTPEAGKARVYNGQDFWCDRGQKPVNGVVFSKDREWRTAIPRALVGKQVCMEGLDGHRWRKIDNDLLTERAGVPVLPTDGETDY